MKNMSEITRSDAFQFVLRLTLASAVSYFSVKWMLSMLDPSTKGRKKARIQAEEQLRKLNLPGLKPLDEYEQVIASRLVLPEDISVSCHLF